MGLLSDWLKKKKSNRRKTAQQKDVSPSATTSAGDKKHPYIGIRCSTTGYFGHSFRNKNGEVFSVGGMVVPEPDIFLKGFGKELWCKKIDTQITLLPGVCRNVTDEFDNCYGSYIYSTHDAMCLQIGNEKISVTVNNMGWIFCCGSKEVARISRLPEACRTRGFEDGFDTQQMYFVEISENLDAKWYPLILGTPMIGF